MSLQKIKIDIFSIENILHKVIFCTFLYPGYPGNVPIKNPKPGGLNTRLIGHLNGNRQLGIEHSRHDITLLQFECMF